MKKNQLVRLQKYMADCGIASRRKSEEMIADGMVKVNGRIAVIGDKVNPVSDKIVVKGRKLNAAAKQKRWYIMINKPRGYVTTMNDEMGRKCVAELVKDIPASGTIASDNRALLISLDYAPETISLNNGKTPAGIHTYNSSRNLEVVDLKYYKKSFYRLLLRLF